MHYGHASLVAGLLLLNTACTKVPQATDTKVASIVQERLSKRVKWNQSKERWLIDPLLQKSLSLNEAIQVALLNNPNVQATFEELGIAQADLVQAGLFQNPMFEGFLRFPTDHKLAKNSEFTVSQGFMDVFLIPLRQKVKKAELEQAELKVAHMVLELGFEVQEVYYKLQAEESILLQQGEQIKILEIKKDIAERQAKAGNINELELLRRYEHYSKLQLDVAITLQNIAALRQEMHRLLGLRSKENRWKIEIELAEPREVYAKLGVLEEKAIKGRLDIAHAKLEVKRLEQIGATKEWWAYANPSIGFSGEKDTEGHSVFGPTFMTAMPFFDHGQADRARLVALHKQSQHRLEALEINIISEVRQSIHELEIARAKIDLVDKVLIPLEKRIVDTSIKMYNVMGYSLYKLLDDKEQEFASKIERTKSLRDYWLAYVKVSRAVGGVLVQ